MENDTGNEIRFPCTQIPLYVFNQSMEMDRVLKTAFFHLGVDFLKFSKNNMNYYC